MVDPFATTIIKLKDMGFFHLLLYMLASAVFYGLLRKTQIFGPPEKNVAVNATVALVAAFMVLAVPVLRGIDIIGQFEMFFLQSLSALFVIVVGVMAAGVIFPQDLPKHLSEKLGKGGYWATFLVGGILVGLIIFITSGMTNIFFPEGGAFGAIPQDLLVTVGVVITMMIVLGVIVWFTTKS
jgi:FtsH-binding integral membrane protein